MKGADMKRIVPFIVMVFAASGSAFAAGSRTPDRIPGEHLALPGLARPVEIIKDAWGISHIYAETERDLFFAQGFNVARDRLFQLEIWRRRATGTLSEILGESALLQDIGLRLLKSRVDIRREMRHYHSRGEAIITSFVSGINAFINHVERRPEELPLEFRLLGIQPRPWTPEVVVSRHNGLFRNLRIEVAVAMAAAAMGPEEVRKRMDLHPGIPDLTDYLGPDLDLISPEILSTYNASRSAPRFTVDHIIDPEHRASDPARTSNPSEPGLADIIDFQAGLGSNNWVVSGNRTLTGFPFMANDPHRSLQIPSLRYWVHLNAPGWNVIGGGEPCLPGVSIGHNEHGAWGLTIFAVDQEDLFVYETHPDDPLLYRYRGDWERMTEIRERIPVRGREPVEVDLRFTRHGPVLHQDRAARRAYALRAAWLEVGGAPYLASLRMDQARSWDEFRDACTYSHTPSENMVWADREGRIGWQAVGIAPIRHGWDGLLPVPGDGRFEWEGYRPIRELPHLDDPPEGFFSSSNQDNIPPGYPHSLGFMWAPPFRHARVQEVLGSGRRLSMADMTALQQDWLSIPARCLVPLLKGLRMDPGPARQARDRLLKWDFIMNVESPEAAVYQAWQRRLNSSVWSRSLPDGAADIFPQRSLKKTIEWTTEPDGRFGPNPTEGRDRLLIECLEQALADLTARLGEDMENWRYGQERYHHVRIRHPLSEAVDDKLRLRLDLGPVPRGGNNHTVNKTSSGYNQTSGASFRLIADCSDWDLSLGTNTPGQSGNPDSPHYRDLFDSWAAGRFFPVFFSRPKIESAARSRLRLLPAETGAPPGPG